MKQSHCIILGNISPSPKCDGQSYRVYSGNGVACTIAVGGGGLAGTGSGLYLIPYKIRTNC